MITPEHRAVIIGFLSGMYYAGKLPSRVEIPAITAYLATLMECKSDAIRPSVVEAMETMHRRLGKEEGDIR